jgi:hypothetical protein
MQLHSPNNAVLTLPGFMSYLQVAQGIEPITLSLARRQSEPWSPGKKLPTKL